MAPERHGGGGDAIGVALVELGFGRLCVQRMSAATLAAAS
jgi:hypothetical protein